MHKERHNRTIEGLKSIENGLHSQKNLNSPMGDFGISSLHHHYQKMSKYLLDEKRSSFQYKGLQNLW